MKLRSEKYNLSTKLKPLWWIKQRKKENLWIGKQVRWYYPVRDTETKIWKKLSERGWNIECGIRRSEIHLNKVWEDKGRKMLKKWYIQRDSMLIIFWDLKIQWKREKGTVS